MSPKPYPECKTCALKDAPYVPHFAQTKPTVAIVGEAPVQDDVDRGKPFASRGGRELQVALSPHLGTERFHLTNAVLCMPPGNDLRRCRATGKRAKLTDPVKACQPRLLRELSSFKNIITLGAASLESVCKMKGIQSQRGFPLTLQLGPLKGARVLPTLHPAFVLKRSRWRHVFRSDISKAFRFFNGKLNFKAPNPVYSPTFAQLKAFLLKYRTIVFDIETDNFEPLIAGLRCIGLSSVDGRTVLVIPFASVQGSQIEVSDQIKRLIKQAMKTHTWVGHNAGYYDRMVMEKVLGCTFAKDVEDTILMHHCTESELPHSLSYLGSVHTDISSWKEERHGLDYESDHDLWFYNAKDCVVTASLIRPLTLDLKLKEQTHVYQLDKRLQRLCVDLHRVGMSIDPSAVKRHADAFRGSAAAAAQRLRKAAGSDFNPGSSQQVAAFLYDELKLPYKQEYDTDTGARGTGMPVIRAMLVGDERNENEKKILEDLHIYRRARKFLKTFVESNLVLSDGRVHADFNAHATVSGRLSGSNPNLQQIPFDLRDMFVAGRGHVFVAADADQIELRMCAALAGARKYLGVFAKKEDPHSLTADLIYGEAWRKQDEAARKKLRDFGKRFCYGNLYGAGDKTILEVMRSVEAKDGSFPYLNTKVGDVIRNRRAWLSANSEFEVWWDQTIQQWREREHLEDCIQHRRRFFLDGLDRNAMVNFPVQAASAGVVHDATFELIDGGVTHGFEGPGTGLVYQGHDQLVIECREASAPRILTVLTKAMNRKYAHLPVEFTATAKIGSSWKDLK